MPDVIATTTTTTCKVYKDFLGLNLCIYDPIERDRGTFGANTNIIGYDPRNGIYSYSVYTPSNWYTDPPGAGNNSIFTAPEAGSLAIPIKPAKLLVLLNLHRNGLGSYSTWKQIRASKNHLTRYQLKNNIYSYSPPCEMERIRVKVSADMQAAGAKETSFWHKKRYCDLEYKVEPMVSSKYLPLQYNFGHMMKDSRLAEFTLKADLTNECRFFTNNRMNDLYASRPLSTDDYEQAKAMYLDNSLNDDKNPIDSIELIKYREIVYPKEQNAFLNRTRRRVSFTTNEIIWRDKRKDRNSPVSVMNSTVVNARSSWDLDPVATFNTSALGVTTDNYYYENRAIYTCVLGYYSNTAVGEHDSLYTGTNVWSPVLADGSQNPEPDPDPGILQNVTSQFAFFDYTIGGVGGKSGFFFLLPTYYRRNTTAHRNSVVSPSGWPGIDKTVNSAPFESMGYYHIDQRRLYRGDTKWTAGEQRTAPKTTKVAGDRWGRTWTSSPRTPFYDTYEKYSEYIALIGKDYSIVPEFNISDNLIFYLKAGTSEKNLDYLEAKGASSDASSSAASTFYETYSNSDFLKMFDIVVADNKDTIKPSVLKLTCKGIKKFIPYRGFYPAQRTAQIAMQFQDSYADNIKVSEGLPLNVSEHPSSSLYWLYSSINAKYYESTYSSCMPRRMSGGRSIKPIHTAMFSPGILFNTIKSGIACDWPIISPTSGNTIAAAMGYYTHIHFNDTNPQNVAYRDFSLLGSIDASGDSLKVCPYFSNRIPFEAISSPEEYMGSYSIVDMDPDPLGYTGLVNEIGPPTNNYYKLMVNNFLAMVPRFFLKNKRFTTFESRKQGDPKFGNVPDKDQIYGMRIKIRRTTTQRYKLSTSDEEASIELPQDRDPDGLQALMADSLPVKETFTMYSRPSAFGPPCAGLPPNSKQFSDDDFNHNQGHNFPFTPPYYHGHAWADIIFTPLKKGINSINDIFENSKIYQLRFWQGKDNEFGSRVADGNVSDGGVRTYKTNSPGSYSSPASDCEEVPSGLFDLSTLKLDQDQVNDAGIELTGLGVTNVGAAPSYQGGGSSNATVNAAVQATISPAGYYGNKANGLWGGPQYSLTHGTSESGSIDVPINKNAMHVDSSVNIFVKSNTTSGANSFEVNGLTFKSDEDSDDESRWIIQTKFETPTLNFNHVNSSDLVKIGGEFGAGNTGDTLQQGVGMWHQHGRIPEENEGIFIEITDIPSGWYDYVKGEIYSKSNSKILSLADLVGFPKGHQKRIGELAERTIIREAIVAVPFKEEEGRRKYYKIDKEDFELAVDNYEKNKESENTMGRSIIDMVEYMKTYMIPPEMDFLTRKGIDPFAMYFFEFKHELTKQDLADLWQNLPPSIGVEHEVAEVEVSHELLSNELLGTKRKYTNAANIIRNNKQTLFDSDIQWMVFKVKQRADKSYKNLMYGQQKEKIGDTYNWPYDYFSLVELIKIEAEVELSDIQEQDGRRKPKKIISKRFRTGNIDIDGDS